MPLPPIAAVFLAAKRAVLMNPCAATRAELAAARGVLVATLVAYLPPPADFDTDPHQAG